MANTTADKLNKLSQTKEDFKTIMTDIGLDVTNELPFSGYPELLTDINQIKKVQFTVKNSYETNVGMVTLDSDGSFNFDWFSDRSTKTVTTFAGAPVLLGYNVKGSGQYNSRFEVLSGSLEYVGQLYVGTGSSSFRVYIYRLGSNGASIKY